MELLRTIDALGCMLLGIVAVVMCLFLMIRQPLSPFLKKQSKVVDDERVACVHCGYDVRQLLRCPECGQPTREARLLRLKKLEAELPADLAELRSPLPEEQPVVVFEIKDAWALRLLAKHLEAGGIIADVTEAFTQQGPVFQPSEERFKLTVWSGDASRARLILKQLWHDEQ